MQFKKAISDWENKWFFVAEKTPRVTIALVSVAVGLAVGISVDMSGRADGSFWVRQAAKFLGLIATLVVAITLLLAISGVYNVCKRLADKKSGRNGNT
jgi:hypothetical protein